MHHPQEIQWLQQRIYALDKTTWCKKLITPILTLCTSLWTKLIIFTMYAEVDTCACSLSAVIYLGYNFANESPVGQMDASLGSHLRFFNALNQKIKIFE